MTYNFQRFEATNSRYETRITVTKSNHIGFPTAFFKDNNVGDYRYVVLFYDSEQKVVAIHFTNDGSQKGKFTIMRNSRNYGGGIVATSFFKANRIDPQKYAGRYDFEKMDISEVGLEGEGSLFVIKLKEK
jgi:hypothetical protein